jgi:hypothetical protein
MMMFYFISILMLNGLTYGLTPDQEKLVDSQARVYTRLMLSFHPDEVPFDNFYEAHSDEIDNFARIVEGIRNSLGVGTDFESEMNNVFSQKVKRYIDERIQKDVKPDTFEVIKLWYDNAHVSYFCAANERNQKIPERTIVDALSKFNNKYSFVRDRESFFGALTDEKRKKYIQSERNDPIMSIHHIIPLNVLQEFYKKHFEIEAGKEEELMKTHTYNWFKILQHNRRKILIYGIKQQYGDYRTYLKTLIPEEELNNELRKAHPSLQIQEDAHYSDFMNRMLTLPPGLSFRGPPQALRNDDPRDEFENLCAPIIGEEYFNKVKALYDDIVKFNKNPNEESGDIYDRILSIHLEPSAQIIFEYNPDQWTFENGRYNISQEWRVKSLAQQQDQRQFLTIDGRAPEAQDFVTYDVSDVYQRRKRNVIERKQLEVLKNNCTLKSMELPPPKRHFCYDKKYLMLFPPVYAYCRLFYYDI